MSTAVIIGASAITQRTDQQNHGVDAAGLMLAACKAAAPAALLERTDLIVVPQGTWRYGDPGRLIANGLAADDARTVRVEIGVLQTTILSTAIEAVEEGRADVAVVVGGEALDRRRVATRNGRRATETVQDSSARSDEVIAPTSGFRGLYEDVWDIEEPYIQYALLDSARRARLDLSIDGNVHQIADRWAQFSRTAAENPMAWDRHVRTAEELLDVSTRGNRPLAAPYTGQLVTRMHVDQAAALIICSVDIAEKSGIPRSQWVFPRLTVDCELAIPVVERADPDCCRQWSLIANELEAEMGTDLSSIDLVDLYSCFPIAVAHQVDAFHLSGRPELTLTGGMTFGGGPLNNSALQAMARAVELLRGSDRHRTALVTAVSGLLTKQGAVLFQRDTPQRSYARIDLTDLAAQVVHRRPVVECHSGPATIQAVTVVSSSDGGSDHAVAIVRTSDGTGTVVRSADPQVVRSVRETEWVGRKVHVVDGMFDTRSSSQSQEVLR
ncbi:hypothetical protein CH289_27175 [Rhodococcus sp. RS1C4]|nr:hypothetical protein [Rhodococcus sp. RS1C4]OZC42677.1 hypothetical protein CH289_27175 [Rhodococcus sp. RS1C4]